VISVLIIYPVSQKIYHPTTNDNFTEVVRLQQFLVQILLIKYATQRWFIFLPHLFNVHTLPWETLGTRKSQSQQ